MNRKLLCTWLGLPEQPWPPEPWTLAGVDAGSDDAGLIERQVQERLAKLRCFQLAHPEEATEGMNRLAMALVTLTERAARKSGNGAVVFEKPAEKVGENSEIRDWRSAPPPVRASSTEIPAMASSDAIPVPPPKEANKVTAAAPQDPEAKRGLGTLPKVLERIDQTRQYLFAWERVGRYIKRTGLRLSKPAAEQDFLRWLNAVYDNSLTFPRFVGQPGKPGYRVVAIARLELAGTVFKALDRTQREELAKDWWSAQKVLWGHHRYLSKKLHSLRHRNVILRGVEAVRVFTREHPVWTWTILIGFAVATAFAMAYWR